MSIVMKCLDSLGWLWCFPHEEDKNPTLARFLKLKIPIFWVMGPPLCGKTTISERLAHRTHYNLIKVSQLVKNALAKGGYEGLVIRELMKANGVVTDEIVLNMITADILSTFDNAIGYIIDGFPLDLRQANFFVQHFCKPSIIIFVCLLEDDIITRVKNKQTDISSTVATHNERMVTLNKVYRNYERKTLKIVTNKPANVICNNLIGYLDAHYGYCL